MAEAEKKEEGAPKKEEAEKKPFNLAEKLPMILVLLNTVALLGALGTFVFTRILFKRPPITEADERAKLEAAAKKKSVGTVPGSISFKALTVTLKPSMTGLETGIAQAKTHYATVAMTLQLRDERKKALIEALEPVLMDKFQSFMGRKTYTDLSNVQGRYLLRTQLIDIANQLAAAETSDKESLVTDVFFSTFMIQ